MNNLIRVLAGIVIFFALLMCGDLSFQAEALKKNDDYTLEEIQEILFDYFNNKNLSYELGSAELQNYLLEQLIDGADAELKELPAYELILAYAAEYLYELDQNNNVEESQFQISLQQLDGNDKKPFNLNHVKSKTIGQIKDEVKKEDSIHEQQAAAFRQHNPNFTPFAGYSGSNAAKYARTWAKKRNKLYNRWSLDCTNFSSQAVLAGGKKKKKPSKVPTGVKDTTSYWYSYRYEDWRTNHFVYRWKEATPWIRVVDFYSYWNKRVPYKNYNSRKSTITYARVGDIIQLRSASTGRRYHTTVVTKKANSTIYLSYHTTDTLNKNIKNINDNTNNWTVLGFTR